jgi:hypothetical protein
MLYEETVKISSLTQQLTFFHDLPLLASPTKR